MTSSVLATLQAHRSIRRFQDKPVTAATVQTLIKAAQQSATSMYMQQFSVIQVQSAATKQKIADLAQGPFIAQAPVLLIMVADQARNQQIAAANQQSDELLHGTDKFMAAVFDTTLATAGIVTAAESLGLGSTVLGSIQNDTAQIIDLLGLPALTLPLLGIVLGYPSEQPEQKPRLPLEDVFFQDTYPKAPIAPEKLTAYDQTVQTYYAGRTSGPRQTTFEQMVVENLQKHPGKRDQLLQVIHEQGFLLH